MIAVVELGGNQFMVQKGDIIIIISYAQMEFEAAKKFNPHLIFPNEITNQLN